MNVRTTEILIIGAGTAGLSARRQAERLGKSWLLVESGPHGTTCARVGCMPSKLLIAAAEAAHDARRAGQFGVEVPDVRVDGEAVMRRVRAERDRFVGFVLDDVASLPANQVLEGHAQFVDDHTVRVGDHTEIHFDAVVIATGSSPWIPDALASVADRLLTNEDVFEWTDLPSSVAVFGTGVIGLELGQALHRLGVEVSMFNPFEDLGPFSDPVIKDKACGVLSRELDLNLGVEIDAVEPEGNGRGVRVRWTGCDGQTHERAFECAIAATGRRPNVDRLGLEHTGAPRDDKGRLRYDHTTLQVDDLPMFVAGDVNGDRPLLHEAAQEGRIAAKNAARFPHVHAEARQVGLAIAFTSPNIAIVGQRYGDLDPDDTVIGEVSYDDQGRARVMGINQGHVRIYARKRDLALVGAEMFGPRVEHTAHLIAWAISTGLTADQALAMPFYHPVIEEGLRTALRHLKSRSAKRPPCDEPGS